MKNPFLSAIKAAPHDPLPRMIYADHLFDCEQYELSAIVSTIAELPIPPTPDFVDSGILQWVDSL